MPILNLKVSGKQDAKLSEKLADGLTDTIEKYLRKKPEITAITISFVPAEQWFINKKPLSSGEKRSFYLDIKITESTNLKNEKAAYIKEVFSLMEKLLGALHPASYVYVEEVRADAYGYAGKTQEERYIRSSRS